MSSSIFYSTPAWFNVILLSHNTNSSKKICSNFYILMNDRIFSVFVFKNYQFYLRLVCLQVLVLISTSNIHNTGFCQFMSKNTGAGIVLLRDICTYAGAKMVYK